MRDLPFLVKAQAVEICSVNAKLSGSLMSVLDLKIVMYEWQLENLFADLMESLGDEKVIQIIDKLRDKQ